MANATGAIVSIPSDKLLSTFNLWRPEVATEFYRIYGDQGKTSFDNLRSLGMVFQVEQDTRTTYSEQIVHQNIHIGTGGISTVSAPAGTYSFVLGNSAPNNDFLTSASTSPYTAASYYSPAAINQIISFPGEDGASPVNFTIYNITGTAPTLTAFMQQSDLSQTFTPGNYAAGTTVTITSNSWAEGTGQPDPIVTKPYQDTEYAQIIKTTSRTTGTQMTNGLWVKTYSDSSGNIIGYQTINQRNAELEHSLAICGALWTGRNASNAVFTQGNIEPNKQTEGFIPYLERRGTTLNYVSGGFSVGLFDTIDSVLTKNFAPTYIQAYVGRDLSNEKDNVFKSYFQNNSMEVYNDAKTVSDVFGNDAGLAMTVDFTQFKKGARTYLFSNPHEWNHPTFLGTTNLRFGGLGVFTPMGKMKDTKSGQMLPYFGMGYKGMAGYSRMAEVWATSGAGTEMKVITQDYQQINHRSHIMACHVGGNQGIILNRTN
jgi:hypothetical protein